MPVTNPSHTRSSCLIFCFFIFVMLPVLCNVVYGQAEVAPWGNITGIRVDGQLMEFESNLSLVENGWNKITSTGKERQRPKYIREGNKQIVTTSLDSIHLTEIVQDTLAGMANVNIQITSGSAVKMDGVYFTIALPLHDYSAGTVQVNEMNQPLANFKNDLTYTAAKIKFNSPNRALELIFDKPGLIILKKDTGKINKSIRVYIPVLEGNTETGTTVQKSFSIKATGYIDKKMITLKLDTSKAGYAFDGLGGNFRLQNAKTDPQVIDYCLQNLRVAWSRVEMPWRFWQPEKDTNPIDSAKAGKLHPNVQKAMEMAQRLSKMGIPIILSAWSPPKWAIVGEPNFRHANGVWGNPLDSANMDAIYKSITDYILYLKNNYGVEIAFFSFNESDLGINIRQTGEQHAALIKGLGAYFMSNGLKTKMLLGDNSDATTYAFIYPAMNDADAKKYIGAVSFHAWRGWETETLKKWAAAAKQLNVPLIVAEGSIDAAAWNYPAVFEEQTYALEEINLYVRLLAICQPLSILQWQLTADYSPLAGGGIFNNNEPLHPTQRFWNLKQLSSTPAGLSAMPVTCNRPYVTCAALGNNSSGVYAIHLVNNGASRQITLTGIPKNAKAFHVFVTDKKTNMKEGIPVKVSKGSVQFNLDSESYTTLLSE